MLSHLQDPKDAWCVFFQCNHENFSSNSNKGNKRWNFLFIFLLVGYLNWFIHHYPWMIFYSPFRIDWPICQIIDYVLKGRHTSLKLLSGSISWRIWVCPSLGMSLQNQEMVMLIKKECLLYRIYMLEGLLHKTPPWSLCMYQHLTIYSKRMYWSFRTIKVLLMEVSVGHIKSTH